MRLKDISINNLRRRKGKVFFLTLGLTIGITTVVTLVSITRMMNENIANKLDEFGANILVIPRSEDLSLSYGGMSIGGLAIARALVNSPPILLADEPTGNMDSKIGREMMELFRSLNQEGQTIIMVTHNPENMRFSTRTVFLKDGRIE